MIQTLKQLFIISRPVSWLNTAYPYALGYLLTGGSIDMLFVVGTLYFFIPYNLLMYGVNDVFDYASDIVNPRKGGIEGAITSKTLHPTIVWSALLTNLPFVLFFIIVGTLASTLILLVVLFFVVAYSVARLRFKERPILDSITSSIHFVGPAIFAVSLTNFSDVAWLALLAFFLWGMASHAFGAVQDIVPDRSAGIHSIATFFGARSTVWFALLLYTAAVLLTLTQGTVGIAVAVVSLLYILNLVPFVNCTDETSGTAQVGWRRFIWLNYSVGFVFTISVLLTQYQ